MGCRFYDNKIYKIEGLLYWMRAEEALSKIGLSEGEIKVYLAILKLGSVPVNKIKSETHLHRTTIYDFIEKLLNKGFLNYVTKGNVNYYKATHPSKLLDYVKEKEETIKDILPDLKKLWDVRREDIVVGTHKGREGVKTLLNDMIKVKKNYIAFGVEDSDWEKAAPFAMAQYLKKEEEIGIKGRLLASEETEFIFGLKQHEYRYVSDEYFNPTSTVIYGVKTAIVIWDPLTVIIIENSNLSDSYRKHFEMLWKTAKKKPKKRLRKYKEE